MLDTVREYKSALSVWLEAEHASLNEAYADSVRVLRDVCHGDMGAMSEIGARVLVGFPPPMKSCSVSQGKHLLMRAVAAAERSFASEVC